MNKTSLFSGIALATTVLGLGMASPVFAKGFEPRASEMSTASLSGHSGLLPTPSPQLIAARRCINRRVYHKAYYTRRYGIAGKRVYHPGYYTTERVCR